MCEMELYSLNGDNVVECPICGANIFNSNQECFKCGYILNRDGLVDYDSIDINIIDKILEYNSYTVEDIVRQEKQITPNVTSSIIFCPECTSMIIQGNNFVECTNCGYHGYLRMNNEQLWQEILNENSHFPLDFIEKHKLDNFWVIFGHEYYYSRGHYEKALICYDKAIEYNELNGEAWFEKASVYEKLRDYFHRNECYKCMLKCYNRLLKIDPTDDYTLNRKGEYFLKRNNIKKALKCFNDAIKYDSKNDVYWNNRGDCYKHQLKYDLALECYDKALSINCCSIKALKEKFDYYRINGDFKEAFHCFDRLAECDSDNFDFSLLEEYGNFYYYNEQHSKALLFFEKITDIDEYNAYAWFQKALIYDGLEKYDLMLKCYEKVLEIDPNYDEAWFNMGIYYENEGLYRTAIKCYDNSLKIYPDDESAWFNEAKCYKNLKNNYMMKFCCKKVLSIDPSNRYAKYMLNNL